MRDPELWIIGLMAKNTDALGFIPSSTVHSQYIRTGRYIIQEDERGNPVGYLLHGSPHYGKVLSISQHCIQYDSRLHGYGEAAFKTLIERARIANCRALKLRCAEGLPSNEFWRAMGLEVVHVEHPDNRRERAINVMWLDLWPTLWHRY